MEVTEIFQPEIVIKIDRDSYNFFALLTAIFDAEVLYVLTSVCQSER